MTFPINVDEQLRQMKVESNRIKFKKVRNPERIYPSICVFANDFDNIILKKLQCRNLTNI